MTEIRTGRRKYYDIFSLFYDLFVKLHAHNYGKETRDFLVDSAHLKGKTSPRVLDICCGTGAVILSFAERYPDILAIGYDFSHGMLRKAREKDLRRRLTLIEGDAATLSFADDFFDVVCCSHALYELKGDARKAALLEMRRVVKAGGLVLIMEHEVPRTLFTKMLFYIRMLIVGTKDAREFLRQGAFPFSEIFSHVTPSHTRSGKSKLFLCQKSGAGRCS
jgi:ubiquinone/menaquinone biosynthesis C-methylase UbiE